MIRPTREVDVTLRFHDDGRVEWVEGPAVGERVLVAFELLANVDQKLAVVVPDTGLLNVAGRLLRPLAFVSHSHIGVPGPPTALLCERVPAPWDPPAEQEPAR